MFLWLYEVSSGDSHVFALRACLSLSGGEKDFFFSCFTSQFRFTNHFRKVEICLSITIFQQCAHCLIAAGTSNLFRGPEGMLTSLT